MSLTGASRNTLLSERPAQCQEQTDIGESCDGEMFILRSCNGFLELLCGASFCQRSGWNL
jgi:hypothetical protein